MSSCPSILELTSSPALPPQLIAHIAGCARCEALRTSWEEEGSETPWDLEPEALVVEWPFAPYPELDSPPSPGALHCLWGPESGELLVAAVLDLDAREALVVPVSPEVGLAGDWDVLPDAVLPYDSMLEVWNHLRVLPEQLMEQVGKLSESEGSALSDAVDEFLAGGCFPDGLRQGPALLNERDLRHGFRETEAARVRPFSESWRILFAATTLGGVVRERREEYELQLDELSEELDLPRATLSRLEEDQEDLIARVPKAKMVGLAKRLALPGSMRLLELIHQAAFENAREGPPQVELTLARRRQGVRTASPMPPDNVRAEMADGYVQGLLDQLGARS